MYMHQPVVGRRLDSAERCGTGGNLESSILKTRPREEGGRCTCQLSAALEPGTGLGVGSRGGELEGQCSTSIPCVVSKKPLSSLALGCPYGSLA